MRQTSHKREKYTFISANLQVINAIFNANETMHKHSKAGIIH